MGNRINILFHGRLNDFLPKAQRGQWVPYTLDRTPSIKDVIESLGVPHPEIGEVLVNAASVSFSQLLEAPAQIEVYPVEPESPRKNLPPLQQPAPRPILFVVDGHLGKLARYLRLLGFDSLYDPAAQDKEIAETSAIDKRVVLTRDVGLLKQKTITWG